jgi:hypothetical protein
MTVRETTFRHPHARGRSRSLPALVALVGGVFLGVESLAKRSFADVRSQTGVWERGPKPEKPKRSPVLNQKLTLSKYESWKSFLENAYWSVELK